MCDDYNDFGQRDWGNTCEEDEDLNGEGSDENEPYEAESVSCPLASRSTKSYLPAVPDHAGQAGSWTGLSSDDSGSREPSRRGCSRRVWTVSCWSRRDRKSVV